MVVVIGVRVFEQRSVAGVGYDDDLWLSYWARDASRVGLRAARRSHTN